MNRMWVLSISVILWWGFGSGCAHPRLNLQRQGFRWPLQDVKVTSFFGKRGRSYHEGIDLRAKQGTPVFAAHSGHVAYAGSGIRGYGKLVILRHGQRFSTLYAHNSKILVSRGQRIRQGQLIAKSGKSGHVSGPHLHFELRDGLNAVDPLQAFPTERRVSKLDSLP